jgi:hypothetical protein
MTVLFEAQLRSPHPAPYVQHKFLVELFAQVTNTPLVPGITAIRDYVWCESDGVLFIRRTNPTNDLAWHPVEIPPADSLINFEVLARCRSNMGELRPNHWRRPHPIFRRGARSPMTDPNDNLTWFCDRAEKLGLEVVDAGVELDMKTIGKENRSRRNQQRPAFSLLVANFYGVAKVCDPVLFERALAVGVGDGKAFGLGFIFFWQRGLNNA